MEISTKSWHYRFLKWTGVKSYYMPASLCPYVRLLLIRLLIAIPVAILALIVVGSVLLFLAVVLTPLTAEGLGKQYETTLAVGGAFSTFGMFFGILVAWIECKDDIKYWLRESYRKVANKAFPPNPNSLRSKLNVSKPRTPNVFLQYLKARKEKLCPIIEYK